MSRSIPCGAAIVALGAAAVVAFGSGAVAPAEAAPLAGAAARTVSASDAVAVRYRRHYRRGYYAGRVVEAPFTRVETWEGGRVAVDAPFAAVRVGRRGTWVRAPFVDLYVPR